jgi:hypothetical protein
MPHLLFVRPVSRICTRTQHPSTRNSQPAPLHPIPYSHAASIHSKLASRPSASRTLLACSIHPLETRNPHLCNPHLCIPYPASRSPRPSSRDSHPVIFTHQPASSNPCTASILSKLASRLAALPHTAINGRMTFCLAQSPSSDR